MKTQTAFIKTGIILVITVCVFMTNKIEAKDLGIMGETYPIMEVDFLDFIHHRLSMIQKSGQWQSLQNRVQQDAIHYRDRPKKVEGITRANTTKHRTFDPSIVLDHDIKTHDGKLIAAAGVRVNPLTYISMSKALIFYDADDEMQVKWVLEKDKNLKGRDKLILVNGSVLDQEKKLKKPIYFDQEGKLTSRFSITHVPAIVSQDGLTLLITEIKL